MKITYTKDGSLTLFSQEYNEHYHSLGDGALNETLQKHIYPAFHHHKNKSELVILDICFGLGFNTLASLANSEGKKLTIYSPELDKELIYSLQHFKYPPHFYEFKNIIFELSNNHYFKNNQFEIFILLGDAREQIKKIEKNIDVVYQDPFSPKNNRLLWSLEYFKDIYNLLDNDAILTTYSVMLDVRLTLKEVGFFVYEYSGENVRKSTIATRVKNELYSSVDFETKIKNNPHATIIFDKTTN